MTNTKVGPQPIAPYIYAGAFQTDHASSPERAVLHRAGRFSPRLRPACMCE